MHCRSSVERVRAGREGWVLGSGWNFCSMQSMKHGDHKANDQGCPKLSDARSAVVPFVCHFPNRLRSPDHNQRPHPIFRLPSRMKHDLGRSPDLMHHPTQCVHLEHSSETSLGSIPTHSAQAPLCGLCEYVRIRCHRVNTWYKARSAYG